MLLISMLSERFIYLRSPPKHSTQISTAHTLSLRTSSPSICMPPARNIRRFTTSIWFQLAGTGLFKKSMIRPSFPDASLWVSCCSTAASSSSFGKKSFSPAAQYAYASAQIWSTSAGSSCHTDFFAGCIPTSTGQKRRFPVISFKNSLSLDVPKNTQRRGYLSVLRPYAAL